jgi:hypothetical protein
MKIAFTMLLLSLFLLMLIEAKAQEKENPEERERFEKNMTADPKTGIVPRGELEKSRSIMTKMINLMGAVPNVSWVERGPNNIGGRTRALMWDPNDITKKKVWAGGVSGGLWYNNDITNANTTWQKVNDFWDNIAISSIAYDPSNSQIMYVGTGERGTSEETDNTGSSGTGGGGIWKSVDGGQNWTRLSSTTPDYVNFTTEAGWREIFKIVVNSQGEVFALNFIGVFKSTDGGTTWAALSGTNAPPSGTVGMISDIELGTDDILYVAEGTGSTPPIIYKSTDENTNAFTLITPAGTFDNGRVEIALAPSTSGGSQVIYAVSANSGEEGVKFFLKSTNAGTNWQNMTVPVYDDNGTEKHFVGTQGSYDLILGTHETNKDILYAAGVAYSVSINAGTSWLPTLPYSDLQGIMHVDNHMFAARPGFPNEAIFGNDGGVYYAPNWGNSGANYPAFSKRNKGYNVTQFYSVDMNSIANNGTIIAGAQDNGTLTVTSAYGNVGSGFNINSGDGGLAFVDKVDSTIFISAYVNVSPQLNVNGPINGECFTDPNSLCDYIAMDPVDGAARGKFINPADYDSPQHTLYHNYTLTSEGQTKVMRFHVGYTIVTGDNPGKRATYTTSIITFSGFGALEISFIKLGKTQGVIFLGTNNGDVYKAIGIPTTGNATVALTKIMNNTTTSTGNVSSIDFGTNESTIIITKSNYNIKSVFYTINGGTVWTSKDESTHGLPNMPIRYALINPKDTKQVFLATELGVWSTTDITVANPQWAPTNTQLAHVRCDMLKYRTSDETVAVATHGRGVFTTKINPLPCPTTLVLINPTDNKSSGTTTIQATNSITASNKITGSANVTMKAGKFIELKPNSSGGGTTFEAANGTVFYAYIQGCPN